MKQDEALKLALDALENISTALREDDVLGSDIEMLLNAAAVIRVALAQPEQESTNWHVIDPTGNVVATEKDAIHGWARLGGFKPTLEVLLAHHESGWRVVPAPPLPVQPDQSVAGYCKKIAELIAERDSLRAALAQPERPWVGLTDEERLMVLKFIDPRTVRLPLGFKQIAESIEQLLKQKNA
jgi:hypothetical protein